MYCSSDGGGQRGSVSVVGRYSEAVLHCEWSLPPHLAIHCFPPPSPRRLCVLKQSSRMTAGSLMIVCFVTL